VSLISNGGHMAYRENGAICFVQTIAVNVAVTNGEPQLLAPPSRGDHVQTSRY